MIRDLLDIHVVSGDISHIGFQPATVAPKIGSWSA
jgi:hypothetical protein